MSSSRFIVGATWDDAPHLSARKKAALWASIPPHARAARTQGIPALGSGAIYPFDETSYKIPPLQDGIPRHWKRAFALDAQARVKSHLVGAFDPDSWVLYITHAYKKPLGEPATQVLNLRAACPWMAGVGDCAGLSEDASKRQYLHVYRELGLNITLPRKGHIEVGIDRVYQLFQAGQIRVYNTLTKFFDEIRIYARDARGQVRKRNDHLMDCLRYLVTALVVMTGIFKRPPGLERPSQRPKGRWEQRTNDWMKA